MTRRLLAPERGDNILKTYITRLSHDQSVDWSHIYHWGGNTDGLVVCRCGQGAWA